METVHAPWSPTLPVSAGTAPSNGPAHLGRGRYRIDSWLGAGGMGTVWLGHDLMLKRPVALKGIPVGRRLSAKSVLREARAAARLTHPDVVQVYDVILDDAGCHWIVMEALPGEPLSTIIADGGPLPLDQVRSIGLRLLRGLAAIHRLGLVHRDVKPSNVLVAGSRGDDGYRVVLTDFGLTTPSGTIDGVGWGIVEGSPAFMSPETITQGRFSAASDLYALGVTLYVAIEGRGPFDGQSLSACILAERPHYPPPQRAGPLRTLVEGLMEPDDRRRWRADVARTALSEACIPGTT